MSDHRNYTSFTSDTLLSYLSRIETVAEHLGGTPDGLSVREVGDGNLNLVFIVRGPGGAVIVKQALPYVRLVGERWPLALQRAFFEYQALSQTKMRASSIPSSPSMAPWASTWAC